MIKQITLLSFLFGLLIESSVAQIPYNDRYFEVVFDEITVETDVVYGNAPALNFPFLNEGSTSPQDLLMDIYQPVGDTLTVRPVLICAHSGAFISGNKENEDMVAFCDSMSHRGYVTASIDYRLGMNPFSTPSSVRAAYRAFQDARSAIRFLNENSSLYGIDTNNIFLLGSSAGGYIAQHNMFMDLDSERPPETFNNPDLECLDCSGNDFDHSGKANGILALWGALQDTNLIILDDTLPVFLAHGTDDATVPFGFGSAFGNDNFPPTYGSSLVAEQLESFGNSAETYFVLGAGHEFYGTDNGNWEGEPNPYWDTVFNKVENFSLHIHKPIAGFVITQLENVVMFEDTSKRATNWYWDFGDGYYSTEQNPSHEYGQSGVFPVIQYASNELISWDTASTFVVSTVGEHEIVNPEISFYPNPATDFVTIENKNSEDIQVQITAISGRVVRHFILRKGQTKKVLLTGLQNGLYIIRLQTTHSIAYYKIIKN